MVKSFPLGSQIMFKDSLEKWRESIGCSLTAAGSSTETISNTNVSFDNSTRCSTPTNSALSDISLNSEIDEGAISLNKILDSSSRGQLITDFYKTNNKFEEEQRIKLINIVANYFVENKKHLSLATSQKIENQIIERFKTEKLVSYHKKGNSS